MPILCNPSNRRVFKEIFDTRQADFSERQLALIDAMAEAFKTLVIPIPNVLGVS